MSTNGERRLLNETAAAQYLAVSRSYLRRARMDGPVAGRTPGPPFIRIGAAVRYDIRDLDLWIAANRFRYGQVRAYAEDATGSNPGRS